MKTISIAFLVVAIGASVSFAAQKNSDGIISKRDLRGDVACTYLDENGVPVDGILEPLAGSGLGDVKYSILSEEQYQIINGTDWVIMKNQASTDLTVPAGNNSVFEFMTAEDNSNGNLNLPDARGQFLRVANEISEDGSEVGADLEHGRKLGVMQDDQFQGHSHSAQRWSNREGANGTGGLRILSVTSVATSGPISDGTNDDPRVGKETRPTNLSVNAFVKIKRKCIESLKIISDITLWKESTSCDPVNCFAMDEVTSLNMNTKVSCIKDSIDGFESEKKFWTIGCLTTNVVKAKRLLMLLGSEATITTTDGGGDTIPYLEHLDNRYPYYVALEPSPAKSNK